MVHGVLSARVSAGLADVGTQSTNCGGVLAFAGHGSGRKGAHFGAVDVIGNASHHRLHVLFQQTRSSAMVAGGGTAIASGNAGLVELVGHGDKSFVDTENVPWVGRAVNALNSLEVS